MSLSFVVILLAFSSGKPYSFVSFFSGILRWTGGETKVLSESNNGEKKHRRQKEHRPSPISSSEYFQGLLAEKSLDSAPLTTLPSLGASSRMVIDEMDQGRQILWSPIGPSARNQMGWSAPIGMVRAILTNPNDPNFLLAGLAVGGIWMSTNANIKSTNSIIGYETKWVPVGDWAASTTITSLTWDAEQIGQVAYAGTGYALSTGDFGIGAGILKSTNSGKTWSRLPFVDVPRSNGVGVIPRGKVWANVFDVQSVKAGSQSRLFAATSVGLLVSLDKGFSWTSISSIPEDVVASISCDPTKSGRIMVAVAKTTQAEFYESLDGGGSWTRHSSLKYHMPWSSVYPNERPAFSKVGFIDASGVKRLLFGYTTWYLNPDPEKPNDRLISEDMYWTYGGNGTEWARLNGYTGSTASGSHVSVWVNPVDNSQVMIGGQSPNAGEISFASSGGDGFSPDRMMGEATMTDGQPNNSRIHPDFHTAVSNTGQVNSAWVATDGGVARVDFPSFGKWRGYTVSEGMQTAQAYSGDVDDAGNVICGFHDNQSFGLFQGQSSWIKLKNSSGDGFAAVFSPTSTSHNFMYAHMSATLNVVGVTSLSTFARPEPKVTDNVVEKNLRWSVGGLAGKFFYGNVRRSDGQYGALFNLVHVDQLADKNTSKGISWVPLWNPDNLNQSGDPIYSPSRIIDLGIKDQSGNYADGMSYSGDQIYPGEGVLAVQDGAFPTAYWVKIHGNGVVEKRKIIDVSRASSPYGSCGGVSYTMSGDKDLAVSEPDRVTATAIDPRRPGRAFVGLERKDYNRPNSKFAPIWVTDDYRSPRPNWRPVGCRETGLPDLPITEILVDPQDSRVVYAATQLGLYMSVDGGDSWGNKTPSGLFDARNVGPANVKISHMAIKGRKMYLFTFGRGVWVGDLPSFPPSEKKPEIRLLLKSLR
ncbi:MAG: hypothetical protein H6686_10220 [Fibrobacteria bacterium]|nr:hypothetical protein [Fibrobacteria bacterium]